MFRDGLGMGEDTGSLPVRNNHSGWPGSDYSRCSVADGARDDGTFDQDDAGHGEK